MGALELPAWSWLNGFAAGTGNGNLDKEAMNQVVRI